MKIYVTYSCDAPDGINSGDVFDIEYWVSEEEAEQYCERFNDTQPVFDKFVDTIYTKD
jgi:hypothetical protein